MLISAYGNIQARHTSYRLSFKKVWTGNRVGIFGVFSETTRERHWTDAWAPSASIAAKPTKKADDKMSRFYAEYGQISFGHLPEDNPDLRRIVAFGTNQPIPNFAWTCRTRVPGQLSTSGICNIDTVAPVSLDVPR